MPNCNNLKCCAYLYDWFSFEYSTLEDLDLLTDNLLLEFCIIIRLCTWLFRAALKVALKVLWKSLFPTYLAANPKWFAKLGWCSLNLRLSWSNWSLETAGFKVSNFKECSFIGTSSRIDGPTPDWLTLGNGPITDWFFKLPNPELESEHELPEFDLCTGSLLISMVRTPESVDCSVIFELLEDFFRCFLLRSELKE